MIRIGGGQAGYGDSPEPCVDLVADGIDYLVCDALAEATLAVLQKDRQRDPQLGYVRDLPRYLEIALPRLVDGSLKLISNAGGLNPVAAAALVRQTLAAAGAPDVKVATVLGDDASQSSTEHGIPDEALFANVYLGARPVVDALAAGAAVVITGRVADASLFLAPLVYEFGWSWSDYDLLAAGVTVGHLLECSAQVSGQVFSGEWWLDPDPGRQGFPIAEVEADGTATITKPKGTGGFVTFDTVREQLLYEVHDPTAYLNPDCTVDLTSAHLEDLSEDRVRVSGVTGTAPPETYKGLYCLPSGWMGDHVQTYSWPDAEQKARAALTIVRQRAELLGVEVLEWCEEYFGAGAHHGEAARDDLAQARSVGWEPPEVVARLAWRCATREDAEAFGRGGLTFAMSSPLGRPKRRRASQLLSLHAFWPPRAAIDIGVTVTVTAAGSDEL